MALFLDLLLMVLPLAGYGLYRRWTGTAAPSSRWLLAGLLGLGLGLAGAAWYGFSRSMDRGAVYLPASLDAEGRIRPGGPAPR